MIKKLRKKFVCIMMVIAMLMVGGILGVAIYFTAESMEMQSVGMMRTIAESSFQQGRLGNASEGVRLPYFTVQISSRGDMLRVSGNYFDLSDRTYIEQIVNEALASQEETGELKEQDLRYLKTMTPMSMTIVFSDTSSEEATLENMAYSCLLIFAAATVVFLGISILISHWAIKPVEDAWDQQRQFVADASHELKTPLSVIMANAELMQSDESGEEERKKFAGNILSVTYQMRSLVENMLEMARVDNGTLKMHFTTVDFSQIVNDAVLSFQLLYEEQKLGLRSAVTDGIRLHGSEQHLYQVLDVLLDNALKYSAPKGTVGVQLCRNGPSCTLAVASPGEPIPREELKNIFKRFYRGDKARAMNGSYGLGLSIAESIVNIHKGKIWAESEGGFNIFYVQLPLTLGQNKN